MASVVKSGIMGLFLLEEVFFQYLQSSRSPSVVLSLSTSLSLTPPLSLRGNLPFTRLACSRPFSQVLTSCTKLRSTQRTEVLSDSLFHSEKKTFCSNVRPRERTKTN